MTADAILAELLTEPARADPYPRYRALRELGPIAPLTQGVAGATPFAAVATGYPLVDEVLVFTPRRLAAIEPVVEEVVQRLLDQRRRRRRGDRGLFLRGMSSVPVTLS
ncbi:MAG TPA: hypothetical protein VF557_00665 [Jatrophihabitans sp.]|uniref:hypothetical protein n=1 Tax=Jatrophihabitans sp. TaxID=1932789 RepID=UPI002EF18C6C